MIIPPNLDIKNLSQINGLSREGRKNYYLNLCRTILQANPDGITAAQIVGELKKINRRFYGKAPTLTIYLNHLVALREAYTSSFGNTLVFKPNGTLLHPESKSFFSAGEKSYYVFELKNPMLQNSFIFLQEREKNSFNVERVTGGILIPKDKVYEFTAAFDAALKQVRVYEK